jgi:hypothetical protein
LSSGGPKKIEIQEDSMSRRLTTFVLLLSALIMMVGCGGDVVKSMLSNTEMRAKLMDAIAGDAVVSGEVLDKLMSADATRAQVMEKVLGNGPLMQGLMARMAQDPTMVDGVLNMAVQDSTMKTHLMSVFQGMQMMAKAKK